MQGLLGSLWSLWLQVGFGSASEGFRFKPGFTEARPVERGFPFRVEGFRDYSKALETDPTPGITIPGADALLSSKGFGHLTETV